METAATVISNIAFVLGFAVVIAGTAFGLMKGFQPQTLLAKGLVGGTVTIVALFGAYRAIWGGNLVQLRLSLREAIRRRLASWFIPAQPSAYTFSARPGVDLQRAQA
jgi:hypothetical protein